MSKLQSAHSIISYYQKKYKEKVGVGPALANRNKMKYLIADALEDLSVGDFQKIIDYYIRVESEPSLMSLCYEYDEMYRRMRADAKDQSDRLALLKETEERVKRFRETFGKHD